VLWLEVAAPIATYVGGGMIAYRVRYIKLYKNWRRWQAEAPNVTLDWFGEYSMQHVRRQNTTFSTYVRHGQNLLPPSLVAFLWPFYWPVLGVLKFLRPEVKVPDYRTLQELQT